MKKNLLIVLLIGVCVFIYFRQRDKNYYDMINAVSGATPLAISRDVPTDFSLTIDGLVKKKYKFSSSALNGFAPIRLRTREFSPEGSFLGAYAYTGIPVFNILEGIAPQKPLEAVFDQPLDILVEFSSSSGQKVCFSFNELIMANDSLPVTLAYHREPVKPTSDDVKDSYRGNIFSEELTGLRLISPGEPDVSRYLDNVTHITYTTLTVPDDLLPVRKKGIKCTSESIICIDDNVSANADLNGVKRIKRDNWVMIGHGHGYERTVSVEGLELRSFLKNNFRDVSPEDYFLFVACDGYRCLFSGREIFEKETGEMIIIADKIDEELPESGLRLAPTEDYFADRSMWALSYVVRIKKDL